MSAGDEPFGVVNIDSALVQRLIAAQFPQWADLPIRPTMPQGWDNRSFRLGDYMTVRLPSAVGYTPQIEKEHRWLPFLAPQLRLSIPVPLEKGKPGEGFPWNWSIYSWIEGETVSRNRIGDMNEFAASLAYFLATLQKVDATGGPPPGLHSAFRGGPLQFYDEETRRSIIALNDEIDAKAATEVWETALSATWHNPPVWFHGDVAVANLLVTAGRLSAVIDFGCSGVGDPACDTTIAWTFFTGESREIFRAALPVDDSTWARGRGWTLWKGLITLAEYRDTDRVKAIEAHRVINEVLAENRK